MVCCRPFASKVRVGVILRNLSSPVTVFYFIKSERQVRSLLLQAKLRKLNPVATWSPAVPCALGRLHVLHVFTLTSHWLLAMFTIALI